ncbi:hypothetical protein BDB01DRAFT_782928 [Pilobolus umbonatus]|nr:hypothetical protein BDB01DRAFT_782928 [Pilobolus umbonatus]
MLLSRAVSTTTKNIIQYRGYSTTTNSSAGSFYYKYGTPLVKCAVLASATTLGWQLLWQNLEYNEYRNEAETYVSKLEERLKALEDEQNK